MAKTSVIATDVPAATIAIGHGHPAAARRAKFRLLQGQEATLVKKPFWFNGEHWQRVVVDGSTELTIPAIFLKEANDKLWEMPMDELLKLARGK